MSIEIITPKTVPKKQSEIVPKALKFSRSNAIDSGIKSVIDTVIITPAAKDRALKIILSGFFFFININNDPIIVERPAIKVRRKEKVVLLKVNHLIQYMNNI